MVILLLLVYGGASLLALAPRVETIVARAEAGGGAAGVRGGTVLTATGYVMPRMKAGEILGRLANDDLRARKRQIGS